MGREKVIGPFTFPSRKAVEASVRSILHQTPLRRPLAGPDAELITALVHCHPDAGEKIGVGISSIDVRIIEQGSRCFWITRTDGTLIHFSYKAALDGAPSVRQQVHAALRVAVKDQINTFRGEWFTCNPQPVCELTHQRLTMGPDAHVDHHDPTFAELANTFINIFGGVDKIRLQPSDAGGTEMADRTQLAAWSWYHQQNARLRVIHRSANLTRFRTSAA